nr:hypothetical protein [uncultured Rhodopila sp.]
MRKRDNLPVVAALLLATAAALTSGNAAAREAIGRFVTEAMNPQAADLGGDPGYLLGQSDDTVWPLPPARASGSVEEARD